MRSQLRAGGLQSSEGSQGTGQTARAPCKTFQGAGRLSRCSWEGKRSLFSIAGAAASDFLPAHSANGTAPSPDPGSLLLSHLRTPNSSDPGKQVFFLSEPSFVLVAPPLILSLGLANVALSLRSWGSLFKEVSSLTPPLYLSEPDPYNAYALPQWPVLLHCSI